MKYWMTIALGPGKDKNHSGKIDLVLAIWPDSVEDIVVKTFTWETLTRAIKQVPLMDLSWDFSTTMKH